MELLVLWILCGVVSAVIAVNKGNSGCGWFLLGVLLGPIGLVLSLVVQGKPALVEERRLASGESRRCPACAELVRREAVKCRFCGGELAPLVPPGVTLDGIVDYLNHEHRRATYGAVGQALGFPLDRAARMTAELMYERSRSPRNSWVVSHTGLPQAMFTSEQKHPALLKKPVVITTGDELLKLLAETPGELDVEGVEVGRRRQPTAAAKTGDPDSA